MSQPALEPLWTVDDVARFLAMSKQWVYKHAELGTLPCIRLGSALRFQPEAVRRYVDQRSRRATPSVVPLHRAE